MGFSGRSNKDLMRNAQVKAGTKPKKIARNTMRYIDSDGWECFKLHNTVIIRRAPDGVITLDTGGWNTVTTRDRFNVILRLLGVPLRVSSAYGGRAIAVHTGTYGFGQTLAVFDRTISFRPGTTPESDSAHESWCKAELATAARATRQRSAERRKERAEQARRRKYGNAWIDVYDTTRAAAMAVRAPRNPRKESSHA